MTLDPAWYEHKELEILPHGWTPADELEVAELGDRVSLWLTNYLFAGIYSSERDRRWATIMVMVGAVAEQTSHRGLEFPPAWLPDVAAWDSGGPRDLPV
jgi:hypothetical protein